MSKQSIERRLSDLTNGLGPYAPAPGSDVAWLATRMLDELDEIEDLVRDGTSSRIEYQLAIAVRHYTAWYARGDERTPYLERAISHLRRAIDMGECVDARVELTHILIEEKVVRDLDAALLLADELKKVQGLPDWMSSSVEKAKRWSGKAEVPRDNDFSDLSPAPAAIREERTKLRKLLVDAAKSSDTAKAATVATRLYNLGLLAAHLYGEWDASSGVTGATFDAASKTFRKVRSSFDFAYLGRIEDAGFLTPTDYGRIERALGPTARTITVREIKAML